MQPSIARLLNPDLAAEERNAILKMGRDFVAACIDYRHRYPQTGPEEVRRFVVGLNEFVEFLHPRLNRDTISSSWPPQSSSSSEIGHGQVTPPQADDHQCTQSTIRTGLKFRIPARKRKRVELEDDWEPEDFRPKRVMSEPIITSSVPLHEVSPKLQPTPLDRSYAFYETYYGDRPDSRKRRKLSRTSSNPHVTLTRSDTELLDAAEVLTSMKTQPSPSGSNSPMLPPAPPRRAKSKGRKGNHQTRLASSIPSVRRSARLQSDLLKIS
ncbi:hypothetical protein CPB83DRAFT_910767 [Crepidotus variabilis]|uniref:Uncharacterized protein n=1 Tax=Crepidotus variabilis TaxID=179855 RepID=A0A9P6JJJ0_9AGAR|nr:hypothetical protein CPB83DRAFT_910767 [Crepidotus variabilis]